MSRLVAATVCRRWFEARKLVEPGEVVKGEEGSRVAESGPNGYPEGDDSVGYAAVCT